MPLLSASILHQNVTDMLKCFLNLLLANIVANNPFDLTWIHTQQNMGIEPATKAAKYHDKHVACPICTLLICTLNTVDLCGLKCVSAANVITAVLFK